MAPGKATSRFLVLGCGHTGTTLIAGILHINGYRSYNVSRFFENTELNDLNQRILDGHDVPEAAIRDFITAVEKKTRGKWSLKDPRLSETVRRFYSHIHEPVKIILNYRNPGATVRALIKDKEMFESFLSPAEMLEGAENEWLRRNRAALEFLDKENRSPVLLIHYDDLVDRMLDETLCRFVGHPLDVSFITPTMRNPASVAVREELHDLYADLNRRFMANKEEIVRTTIPVKVKASRRPTLRTLYNRAIRAVRWRLDVVRKMAREHMRSS